MTQFPSRHKNIQLFKSFYRANILPGGQLHQVLNSPKQIISLYKSGDEKQVIIDESKIPIRKPSLLLSQFKVPDFKSQDSGFQNLQNFLKNKVKYLVN